MDVSENGGDNTFTGVTTSILPIDRKHIILAVNPCSGSHYTQNDGVFFCAKDEAFLTGALPGYREKCIELGCGSGHIKGIELMMERVKRYQASIESHVPDTTGICELERCLDGGVSHIKEYQKKLITEVTGQSTLMIPAKNNDAQ